MEHWQLLATSFYENNINKSISHFTNDLNKPSSYSVNEVNKPSFIAPKYMERWHYYHHQHENETLSSQKAL